MTDEYQEALDHIKRYSPSEIARHGLEEPQQLLANMLLVVLETVTRVDGALNAAYVNYDPLVKQVSELRSAFAAASVPVHPFTRQDILTYRDRQWCEALVNTLDDGHTAKVLEYFNDHRFDPDSPKVRL